ncbi:MAG: tetratricopeptide repeat protein, partial [Alkalinema sp. CAN_BIN05]|nr:tetratricopeptide repeat protein [Alkalinema sp. CAN_BIN05]
QAVGDENAQANGLFKVGRLYYRLDDRHQDALENYDQALVLYQSSKNRQGEANTLQAIGDVLQFLDQSQDALNRYETAIEIYRQVGDRLGEANTLKAIGDLEEDPKNGLNRFNQAMQIYQEIGDQYSQARILATSLAPAYIKLNQSYQAKESYEKALKYFEEIDLEAGIESCKDKLRNLNQ